ncbi:hypothetical protein IC762_22390 [Bradyrhizobium genosp. L]|uniref:hypothetical protein n=1 Tax=Bradyrhizobium genosp. L TaxID=83637 RepID=UPI0018A320F5|nr:hypothetical protein [Bradyrhizobium genosp. L]QPF82499.1 hypothetical protein IC762_22390 [Bradyrhizobium genosp. L]
MSKTKIEEKYWGKYIPIVLYWDDVSDIFELLQANTKNVELETTTYKFGTLAAAKEHFGEAPQFDVKLTSTSPYCSIEPGRLYVGSGPTSAVLFLGIDRILKDSQRRPRWLYNAWIVVPLLTIMGFAGFAPFDETLKVVVLAVQLTLLLAYACATYISIRRCIVVHPQRRADVRGFFQRNKDQLLMYAITGVIGALVGFGISQIKDRYFPAITQSMKP